VRTPPQLEGGGWQLTMSTSWYVKPASSGRSEEGQKDMEGVGGSPSSDAPTLGVGHEQKPLVVSVRFFGRNVAGYLRWTYELPIE